jgi:predicted nucleic acid-binding protein
MPKLKTVIDCNIIISAGITDGSCRKAIREILSNHQNYLSQDILLEYKNVISRSKFRL